MGYDIWATGVIVQNNGRSYRYPNYVKRNRHWGDEWETNKLLDVGLSMSGIDTGGSVTGGITVNAAKSLALSTLKRLLGQTLRILTIDSYGDLGIFAVNKNTFWADETHFRTFTFTDDNVYREYRQLLQFLVEADLNKTGPLTDMCLALSGWDQEGKSGRYGYRFSYEWS